MKLETEDFKTFSGERTEDFLLNVQSDDVQSKKEKYFY